MRRVETSWRVLEAVFHEHAHSRFKSLRRPVTATNLAYLERTIGRPLPAPLRRSLLIHDGMKDHQFNPFFNGAGLMPARAIAQEWCMRREAHRTTGLTGPADTDLRIKRDQWWRPGWVPITNENGNYHCIDLDPAPEGKVGQVFLFQNSSGARRVIANDFAAWLDHIASLYHERKFRFNEYGHLWMDDRPFFYGSDQ